MALSITGPTAGSSFGPGYVVSYLQTTGPMAVDDYMVWSLQSHATSHLICGSIWITNGSLAANRLFGAYEHPGIITGNSWRFTPNGGLDVPAPGGAVDLNVQQNHANGSFVDAAGPIALLWDPIGLAFQLTQWFGLHQGGGTQDLSDIRNAVLKQFPNNA